MSVSLSSVASTFGLIYTPLSLNEDFRFSTGTYTGGTGTVPVTTGTAIKFSDLSSRARNAAGTVIWVSKINSASTGGPASLANSVDIDQNIYTCGFTTSSTTNFFNKNSATIGGSITQPLAGGSGAYLVKYSEVGDYVWHTRIDGTSGSLDNSYGVYAESLKNLTNGLYTTNVYQMFTYSGVCDVYSASNQTTPAVQLAQGGNATNTNAGLVKFNSSGTVLWATRFTTLGDEEGRQVRGDSLGNIYITGSYLGLLSFYSANNQGTAAATLPVISGRDLFIAKFDTNGTYIWSAKMGSTGSGEFTNSIGIDSSNNIYLTGYYNAALQVWEAGGSAALFTIPLTGSNDGFIVKYNSNGSVAWGTKISAAGAANDASFGITTDPSGNSYIHGFSTGATLNIYQTNRVTIAATLACFGTVQTGFIIKYDSNGTYIWSAKYGRATTGNMNGQNIAVDKNGDIYGTLFASDSGNNPIGFYNQGATVTAGILAATTNNDGVLFKYNSAGTYQWSVRMTGVQNVTNPSSISITDNAVYVGGYTSSINGTLSIYNANGTAFATTLSSATGDRFSWQAKYAY